MGYFRDDFPRHEGWVVGYVVREGCDRGSGLFRELLYPADKEDRTDLVVLGAGCECGWRSAHFAPDWRSSPPSWGPYSVLASERDEGCVCALWSEHLADIARGKQVPTRLAAHAGGSR